MRLAAFFTGAILLLSIYCAVDPFSYSPISDFPEFEALKIEVPSESEIPTERDEHNLLQKSEIRFLNQIQGPESVAFDPQGRGPYSGVADGRVMFWNGENWTQFAYTSNNRSEICDPKPSLLSYLKNEHICGRPLGIRFDKKTGDLYIADAYLGLMKVGPEGGLATSLSTGAEGIPLGFTNDLDVDDDGNVYFTDSSTKYQRRNFMQLVFSGDDSGRVLKYSPDTKETTVLVRNIQFPNGVSLSKDGSFFVFCEGSIGSPLLTKEDNDFFDLVEGILDDIKEFREMSEKFMDDRASGNTRIQESITMYKELNKKHYDYIHKGTRNLAKMSILHASDKKVLIKKN